MTQELVDRLGFDRLPESLKDKSPAQAMDLSGRVAFVTGGGGFGLGRAIVDRLAAQGATVIVADKNEEAAAHSAAAAAQRWQAHTQAMTCDVTDAASIKTAIDNGVRDFGRLDILVNNVGGGGPRGEFDTNTIEAIDAGVRLNLLSHFYCTQAALPHMQAAKSGNIVCIASEGGKVGMPGLVVYNACKAAIIGFVRNLAFEVSRSGIRINAICPGIMLIPQMLDRVRSAPPGGFETRTLEHAFERVLLERGSLPEEVANAVAFIASDAASYVQGTAWSVGGGQEA